MRVEGLKSSVVGLLIAPGTSDELVARKCGVAVLVDPNEVLHLSPSPLRAGQD